MKKLALVASILAIGSASAVASDIARPLNARAAIIDPVYNWTGFYAGANIGYSWGSASGTQAFTDGASGALLFGNAIKLDMNGVIGGGQIGYNWQSKNWVFGLEADFQGTGQKGGANTACPGGSLVAAPFGSPCAPGHIGDTAPFNVAAFPVTNSLNEKLNWFGTVRGRVGATVTPTILAYVTGGLAYGEISATDTVSGVNITGPNGTNTFTLTPVAGSFGNTTTKFGWTIGAGLEGVVSGNWTAKIEYLYVDLGNVSGAFVTPITAPSGAFVVTGYSTHITDNILRVGLNYKWAGP